MEFNKFDNINIPYDNKQFNDLIDPAEWNENFHTIENYITENAEKLNNTFEAFNDAKENKAEFSIYTLLADQWVDGVYSLEETYPSNQYDIEISLSENTTPIQAEIFNGAYIVGNSTMNTIKSLGVVPTVDIEIIVKTVVK